MDKYFSNLKRIFISHSSKDEIIVNAFIDKVCVLGLGIIRNDIFCTSNEQIKSGIDFKEHIKQNLINCDIVIQIITSNYKNSEVCLNEMGAAWALDKKVIPFILFPVKYDNVGFIHNTSELLRLNNKRDLLQFSDDFRDFFEIKNFTAINYDRQTDEFLSLFYPNSSILKMSSKIESNIPSEEEINQFFVKFLNNELDKTSLILKAQPTLSDCRVIFKEEYFVEVYLQYSNLFKSLIDNGVGIDYIINKNEIQIWKGNVDEIRKIDDKPFLDALNSNVLFYDINFKEYDKDAGVNMHFWCFIHNKWIFIPKFWRIIDRINEMRKDRGIDFIIRTLKFFKIDKNLKAYNDQDLIIINHLFYELTKGKKNN